MLTLNICKDNELEMSGKNIPDTSSASGNKVSSIWTIIALLVLGVILVASYTLKDILQPDVTEAAALDESCDLRKGACTSKLPHGGTASFSITPIQLLKPLTLHVKTNNVDVSSVQVEFVGIDMEMGFNRSKLIKEGENSFKGLGVLSVCVRDRMDWEARIFLETNRGVIVVPFRFYTLK